MGMYDYLRCDRPLEDGSLLEGNYYFQTKDGPCEMGLVIITDDGRLMIQEAHSEAVLPEDRPYWGKPEWDLAGFYMLCGAIRRVVDRVVDANYHGEVRFNRYVEGDTDEYSAIFVDGTCIHLSRR